MPLFRRPSPARPVLRGALGVLALAAALAVALVPLGTGTAGATEFGVYRGPGCNGRQRIPEFETWVGRKVERTVDALNQESFEKWRTSIPWIISCWKGSGLKLTLSVPMLPFDKQGSLAEGAVGHYDPLFKETARQLVANGYADAVVRIGWEFNGEWMPWRADRDPKAYVAYFQRIVTLMRQTPGQQFRFEWTPNHGRHAIAPPEVYPGDDYVDIIGMDVYDEIWTDDQRDPATRWAYYVNQPYGLAWHRDFAAAHKKPMAYSEWGVGQRPDNHGSGDNPYFVAQMAKWIAATKPLYHSYWDNPSATYDAELSSGGRYPRSSAEFLKQFSRSGQ